MDGAGKDVVASKVVAKPAVAQITGPAHSFTPYTCVASPLISPNQPSSKLRWDRQFFCGDPIVTVTPHQYTNHSLFSPYRT